MSGPGDPETGPKGPEPDQPRIEDLPELGELPDFEAELADTTLDLEDIDQPQGDSGVVTDSSHQTPWNEAMQLIADGKFQEAGDLLGLHGDQLNSLIGSAERIGDQETLSSEDEALIIHELTQYNDTDNPLTQEQVDALLEMYHPQLHPDVRKRIVARLKLMKAEDKAKEHEVTDKDKTPMNGDDMMGGLEKLTAEIDRQLINPEANLTEDEKARLRSLKERSASLFEKVGDLFRPGEPGRDFARRLGKTTYWIIMIAFILLVAELNLINNMSKNRRH